MRLRIVSLYNFQSITALIQNEHYNNTSRQNKLMGQEQSNPSKSIRNDEIQLVENPPISLRTFGSLIKTQKIEKLSHFEFALNRGKENEFLIKTNKQAVDLTDYKGFVEVFIQKKRIFAGLVNKLKREGFGIEFDDNQRVFFRGEFADDLYEGWGQTIKYQGQFKGGKKSGWGKWNDSDSKTFYEGFFKDDKLNGVGYLNLQVEEITKFISEDSPIDPSEKIMLKYAGQWVNSRMSGNGKLATREETYKGNFSDGLYNGQGMLKKQGKVICGKFYQGKVV